MNIIYLRTSTEEQNPENQLKECLSINKFGEYSLIEDKESAWKKEEKREGFIELLKLIKANKVEHLIVWDWDRIYRNRKKLKAFFELCKIYKTKIHSFRQSFYEQLNSLPEPFNEIMESIWLDFLGWLAQDESDKKSMRVKSAIRTDDGITKSYKGNRWGFHSVGKNTDRQILEERSKGKTINQITKEVFYWNKNNNKKFVSVGYAWKIINKEKLKNVLP